MNSNLAVSVISVDALEASDEIQAAMRQYKDRCAFVPQTLADTFSITGEGDEMTAHIPQESEPTLIEMLIKNELIPNWTWFLEDSAEGCAWVSCSENKVSMLICIFESDV